MAAYSWDNRVRFIVRHMYDIDGNGYLDKNDFESLALKSTVIEGKGGYDKDLHEKNKKLMADLWNEIAAIADFDKDGQVTVDEFKKGVQSVCKNKKFSELPNSLKFAIDIKFQSTDMNGDGCVGIEEYRLDCVARAAFCDIKEIDDCYHKLISEADKEAGGIMTGRYQELYAQFIGCPDTDVPGSYLFGPLEIY